MSAPASIQLDLHIQHWIEAQGRQSIEQVFPVAGGKNNQALKIVTGQQALFFKQYFADDCQRFQRETEFVQLLNLHKVDSVAQLIGSEQVAKHKRNDHEYALFSMLPGQMPTQAHINKALVLQAAQFVAQINQPQVQQSATHLLNARGGLATAQDFIDEIPKRLEGFKAIEAISKDEELLVQALLEFLNGDFTQAFEQAKQQAMDYFSDQLAQPFERVLSPSDIGFHNTLFDASTSKLSFFDFEYAGWDSAEKLITDFFAQPRFDIAPEYLEDFIATAFHASSMQQQARLLKHCQVLLPLAHLKWALIFLNEFKHHDSQRRAFAANCLSSQYSPQTYPQSSCSEMEYDSSFEKRQQQLKKAQNRAMKIHIP